MYGASASPSGYFRGRCGEEGGETGLEGGRDCHAPRARGFSDKREEKSLWKMGFTMKKDDTVIEGERDADASLRCSDAFIVWTPKARERGHGHAARAL